MDAVTSGVQSLYEQCGWIEQGGVTYDAETCEDLRDVASDYLTACRRRVLRHLPSSGDRLLDVGSGPIQYPEYLEYSGGFNQRVCVDLSSRALDGARLKLGDRGEYLLGDFLEIAVAEGAADAAVSLHVLYHIAADRQAAAVRKIIRSLRPGAAAVIVYSNPAYPVSWAMGWFRRLFAKTPSLYFFRHPLSWWRQFETEAKVQLHPWRTLTTREQRALIPDNRLGRLMLRALFAMEDRFPRLFVRLGCYPMIVLTRAFRPAP